MNLSLGEWYDNALPSAKTRTGEVLDALRKGVPAQVHDVLSIEGRIKTKDSFLEPLAPRAEGFDRQHR